MTPDKQRGSGASHKDLHTALDYLDEPIECSEDHYEGNQSWRCGTKQEKLIMIIIATFINSFKV